MFRWIGAVLIVLCVLALVLHSNQRTTAWAQSGTYTTTPFPVSPRNISLVDDTAMEDGTLVLFVDTGACTRPAEQMTPVTVSGAPRGAFHVGQLIATGVLSSKGLDTIVIRAVTREEAQRVGCSAAT
jgi:hypothetical protein